MSWDQQRRLIEVNERIYQLQDDNCEPLSPTDEEAVYELRELQDERRTLERELGEEVHGLQGYYGGPA